MQSWLIRSSPCWTRRWIHALRLLLPAVHDQGSTSAKVMFPMLPLGGYTLFHVMRYAGPAQRNIITSPVLEPNAIYSGFYFRGSAPLVGMSWHAIGGAIYYNPSSWKTAQPRSQWVLSMDQWYRYHSQGVNRTYWGSAGRIGANASAPRPDARIGINIGAMDRTSDWAMAALLIYRRELNDSEVLRVEDYLSSTYGIPVGRLPWPMNLGKLGNHAMNMVREVEEVTCNAQLIRRIALCMCSACNEHGVQADQAGSGPKPAWQFASLPAPPACLPEKKKKQFRVSCLEAMYVLAPCMHFFLCLHEQIPAIQRVIAPSCSLASTHSLC